MPSRRRSRRARRAWIAGTVVLAAAAGAAVAFGVGGEDPPRLPPTVVWAVGDAADGGEASRAVAERIVADRPDRLLYLGDVYETGTAEEFRANYHSVYGSLGDVTAPTPGNHEWPTRREGYFPYWRSVKGEPLARWYALSAGGWRLLSLNSEAPHEEGSPQLRFLEEELARGSGTCTLAFWHRPFESAGTVHGDHPDLAPLWNALRGHARLVVTGHEHDLQRLRPRDGITQYISGAGGHQLYPVDESDPRLEFSEDERFGALRIELRPGRADLAFIASDGSELDRSSAECEP
jgi:hypothetical protein